MTQLCHACVANAPARVGIGFSKGWRARHAGMTELCPLGTVGALKGTLGPVSKAQQVAIKSKQARALSALHGVHSSKRRYGARALS